jgi:hypothetical protein
MAPWGQLDVGAAACCLLQLGQWGWTGRKGPPPASEVDRGAGRGSWDGPGS